MPIFKRQIAAGGPVTVTHPEVTRYFMTIPEAVGLVLQSAAFGSGGEILVPWIWGEPVKIIDLARQLIELSGLRAGTDIEIQFTGLRPGEKMFEELSHYRENLTPTSHPKVMRFVAEPRTLDEVRCMLQRFRERIATGEAGELKGLLKEAVPEYLRVPAIMTVECKNPEAGRVIRGVDPSSKAPGEFDLPPEGGRARDIADLGALGGFSASRGPGFSVRLGASGDGMESPPDGTVPWLGDSPGSTVPVHLGRSLGGPSGGGEPNTALCRVDLGISVPGGQFRRGPGRRSTAWVGGGRCLSLGRD